LLLALLVLVVLLQLFPQQAPLIKALAVGAGVLYFATWSGARYFRYYRRKSAYAAQEGADEAEYQQYKSELDAIRAKFDPARDLSDLTEISPEYREALTALHDKHQALLDRKFGPR
jgi:hypothetical protein